MLKELEDRHNRSLVTLFHNPAFAPRSKVAENQWYLIKKQYVAMRLCEDWDKLYTAIRDCLQYAKDNNVKWLCDDYITWTSFSEAAKALK
jgi:hypothetical protein